MPTITWVHISDLHLQPDDTTDWWAVREALLRDLTEHRDPQRAEQAPRAGVILKPDLLFLTGDLANMGKPFEYEALSRFLDEVWRMLELGPERTFIVPGNHDVDRSLVCGNYIYEKLRNSVTDHHHTEQSLSDELRQLWPDREVFFKKFAAYEQFAKQHKLVSPTYYVHPLDVNNVPLEIVGINSAWIADRDDEDSHRQLILGMPQLDAITRDMKQDASVIRIALMHHPPGAIHPSDKSPDRLATLCPVILHGHLHVAKALYLKELEHEPLHSPYKKSKSLISRGA